MSDANHTEHTDAAPSNAERETGSVVPEPIATGSASRPEDTAVGEDDDQGAWSRFVRVLERNQWVAVVIFVVGVVLVFAVDPSTGLSVVASAIIAAGLVPVLSGRYRSPFGLLRGMKARARGLVSVLIGIAVLALATSL